MSFKTPGVYIKEVSLFPPSVAQVETAIPAFVGYTQKAEDLNGNNLTGIPKKINSLVDYELYYGLDFDPVDYQISFDGDEITAVNAKQLFLYKSLKAFYDNGGGACYVVSAGSYTDDVELENGTKGLKKGIASLEKFDEPTIILFPDAMATDDDGSEFLDATEVGALQQQTLAQCNKLQDRFGLFDVKNATADNTVDLDQSLQNFRDNIGSLYLKYGAAYFPWMQSSYQQKFRLRNVTDDADVSVLDLPPTASDMITGLKEEIARVDKVINLIKGSSPDELNVNMKTFLDLRGYYKSKVKTLLKATTVDDEFQEILFLLRRAVLIFTAIDSDSGMGPDIDGKIATLKEDKTLIDEIIYIIQFEKAIAGTEISDKEDVGTVEAVYADFNSNTDWLDGTSGPFTNVGDIDALADLDFTGVTQKTNQARRAMEHLEANLDANKLLGSMQQLFETLISNEESKEQQLINQDPFFKNISIAIRNQMSLLPPSGYIAGVYSAVDRTRGVWKAPANVSLNAVVAPQIKISDKEQESMNEDTSGKSVNAIRAFAEKGILIWGARTLAGNDNEWRYISVRRFYNMVEESVKKATEQFVFENNDANTWVKVRSMIRNYLTVLWRQGAMAGASTEDAFYINIGLGETMTALDIMEGRMIVEIGMAVVRPAEFIVLRFTHKMIEA